MDITVAVALITSLSTLGGGLIGSATSVTINHSQSHKEKLAKRRELRRDAYMQLLNKFDEMVVMLENCWMLSPSDYYEDASRQALAVNTGLFALENATNAVQLEGPAEIIAPAREMYNLLNKEFNLLLDVANENQGKDEIRKCFFQLSDKKYFKARDSRPTAKKNFIDAARKVLD
jgi:hypothetical protein